MVVLDSLCSVLDIVIEGVCIVDFVIFGVDGCEYVVLFEWMCLYDISDLYCLLLWVWQVVMVDDWVLLFVYVNCYSIDCLIIVVDFDVLIILVWLDWYVYNMDIFEFEVGYNVYFVMLVFRLLEEFVCWDEMEGKIYLQVDFVWFFEENSVDIEMFDVVMMIEISKDFEVMVGQIYKLMICFDNGDCKMIFEIEMKVQNSVVIFEKFILLILIYNGEEFEEFSCLFCQCVMVGGVVGLGF